MSKASIVRKGKRFVSAHNARVLRATKHLTKAVSEASIARLNAAFDHGLNSPEYDLAKAACDSASQAMWAARTKAKYITINDRVLVAVFGA